MAGFITIDNIEIDVVRQKGRRRLSLSVNQKKGRAQVAIPWFCPIFVAKKFVSEHIVWLKKNLEVMPLKKRFGAGLIICILGKELTVFQTEEKKGVFIDGDKLYVSGKPEFCHRRVKDFIKKEFYNYAYEKASEYANQTGKDFTHITIRDTSSRWGSCSSSGTLSFCWRLALAPTFVIDYVIAHEVAHLSQMNHSVFFWSKVKQINNDTYIAKKWLKQNSLYLHSFE